MTWEMCFLCLDSGRICVMTGVIFSLCVRKNSAGKPSWKDLGTLMSFVYIGIFRLFLFVSILISCFLINHLFNLSFHLYGNKLTIVFYYF